MNSQRLISALTALIYSKITSWKRNYDSLMMMLNHSGIGFNSDDDYKIECDDEQWAQFVKVGDSLFCLDMHFS